ncbi:MAG: metal-dependent hydrolase [Halococcoides sp.]
MNKRGHVWNAILLSIGVGVVLEPSLTRETVHSIVEVSVPIVLGALFPDVDTAIGRHRETFHNLAVLGIVAAYPVIFGNLQFVWIGVLSHYLLDLLGTKRGITPLYPVFVWEFEFPTGVTVDSKFAGPVTLAVTGVELVVLAVIFPEHVSELAVEASTLLGVA